MNSENDKQEHSQKNIVKECSATIGLADSVQVQTTHIAWQKDWLKLIAVALLTAISQYVTSFLIIGLCGFLIGLVVSVAIFFLSLWGMTKIITKKILS